MPTKLILPGTIVTPPPEDTPGLDLYVKTSVLRAQEVPPMARGGRVEESALEGALDTDLVEIEYENGIKQWVSVEQLRRDVVRRGGQRSAAGDEIRLPATIQLGDATRGKAMDLVVKFIRVIRSNPADAAGELAANLLTDFVVVRNFEDKLVPNPGLYRIGSGFTLRPDTGQLDNTAPYLLFIHGTASNTMGGFGSMVAGKNVGLSINPPQTDEWKQIASKYGDRMLAFEHPTLTWSPIDNAIQLASKLPDGARLHMVTHSRGGLVGELLCLERPSKIELDRMRQRGRSKDADGLETLCGILETKKFQVERFVRVACPARGTVLASGRVDTYLTILFNLLKLIQPLSANPVFAFLEATIRETAKMRTDPGRLPGLEAMMPESPLIRLLNTKELVSQADLGVIAGDVQGEGILGTLKILAIDLFYLEDHDLVVNTRAMYGGVRRKQGAFFYFERGAEVNHFNYFGNASTRSRLLEWLKGEMQGFQKIEPTRGGVVVTPSRGADTGPVLFLIPGFMASNIVDGQGTVWYDFDGLAAGRARRLDIGVSLENPPLSIVGRGYQAITNYLGGQYAVKPFAYDWRQSIVRASAGLAQEIRKELDAHQRPISILAHSQGALVALHYIATNSSDWQQVLARKGRLVMLGAPLGGSFGALQAILGRDRFTRMLALLDDGQTPELKQIVASWPGLHELLPRQPVAAMAISAQLSAQRLAEAQAVMGQLDAALKGPAGSIVQLLGVQDRTVTSVRTNENGVLEFETSPDGDGWIGFEGNTLPGQTWYMNAAHGDLPDTESAFPAIYDLLDKGTTVRLPSEPPARSRIGGTEPLREERPLFPDEESLLDAALIKADRGVKPSETRSIKVSVLHADLRYSNFPIMVGHYQGDTIVHAEQVLDEAFDKALSARYQMGIYPGPAGTSELILRPEGSRPRGAIIAGLGEVGNLTADHVRESVLNAALKNAMAVLETRQQSKGSFQSAAFSALLLGTFGQKGLTVAESVGAILQAAIEANRALRSQGLWDKVRIDAVQFVELYEETAIQAAYAVNAQKLGMRLFLEDGEALDVNPDLQSHASGRQQAPANQYDTGWFRRLEITSLEDHTGVRTLHYKLLTDRARNENIATVVQKEIVDELVERAISSPSYDQKLSGAMYELLWPNELKEQQENRANLSIEVDSGSAQIPWEMMVDRTAKGDRILAVESGLLRKFQTDQFRRAPRMSFENTALVIGDPKVDDPAYPALPGARAEASLVSEVLSGAGFATTTLIQPNTFDVVTSLFARDYRIVHIAAHGQYNPRTRTGVVMSGGKLLTAAEFRQMRVLPDLVFLNCCHLGRIDPKQDEQRLRDMNKLAASVAEQLICEGVRAVVVAGWAVNDSAALTFARRLYEGLIAGENFGSATLEARKETFSTSRGSVNTWAAYQCYGSADFTLAARGRKSGSSIPAYRSRREYLDHARNVVAQGGAADPAERERLLEELRTLERLLPLSWRDGEMLASYGEAYSTAGSFPDAVRLLQAAINDVRAGSPIRSLERLANLENRQAREVLIDATRLAGPERKVLEDQALTWTNNAIRRVEWLLQLGETSERTALLAGAYKRRAWASAGDDRTGDLQKSKEYYGKAARLNPDDLYPALNEVAMRFLLGETEGLLAVIETAKAAALEYAGLPVHQQEIWNRVTLPDALLLEALIRGNLIQQLDDLVDRYRSAVRGERDWRTLASIRSQVELLRDFSSDPAVRGALDKVVAVLNI